MPIAYEPQVRLRLRHNLKKPSLITAEDIKSTDERSPWGLISLLCHAQRVRGA